MKKLLLLLLFPLFLGSTSKYQYKYKMPFAPVIYQGINDSIPTIDKFGRIRNGIIAQRIIDTMNNDPSGVDLTRAEQDYVRAFVGGLYVIGVWQKTNVIYGYVGTNAYKHKWNWKDMRNVDAAFRQVFFGGVTHSSDGIQFNGSTGYADTNLIPSTSLSNTSTHLYAYIKSSSTSTSTTTPYVIGAINSPATGNSFGLINRHNGTSNLKAFVSTNPSVNDNVVQSSSTATPFLKSYSGNLLSGDLSLWSNGVKVTSTFSSNAQSDLSNTTLLIGATNNTVSPAFFDNKLLCAVMIGPGLTDIEIIKRDNVLNYSQAIYNR